MESNAKKCAFLAEVVRRLSLTNVTVRAGRMESYQKEGPGFDFVTARALGHFDQFLSWSKTNLKTEGRLILWLGQEDAIELSRRPGWIWTSPVPIPGTSRRVLLIAAPEHS